MKTFLLALILQILGLHGSKANMVTSCLQCITVTGVSEDSECIGGTGKGIKSMIYRKLHLNSGTECAMEAEGCFVTMSVAYAYVTPDLVVTTWDRGCCTRSAQCTEIHGEQGTASGSNYVDQLGYVCFGLSVE